MATATHQYLAISRFTTPKKDHLINGLSINNLQY